MFSISLPFVGLPRRFQDLESQCGTGRGEEGRGLQQFGSSSYPLWGNKNIALQASSGRSSSPCWNLKATGNKKGLWTPLVLGSWAGCDPKLPLPQCVLLWMGKGQALVGLLLPAPGWVPWRCHTLSYANGGPGVAQAFLGPLAKHHQMSDQHQA